MALTDGDKKYAGSLNSAMIAGPEGRAAQEYANHFLEPGYEDITKVYIEQHYEGYTEENQESWRTLYDRQMAFLATHASGVYLSGARSINLVRDHIPYLEGQKSVNHFLQKLTGWQSRAVPGYLPAKTFFACLARREFPTTVVIRPKESLDYLPEPDIFHEIFGHCPLLTNPWFAEFTHTYGKLGLQATKEERVYLARLYWMTIEFGLVDTPAGLRIYGGGILSSPKETVYSLSAEPEHQAFDPLEAMRTPYRIDILQPLYFVLPELKRLFEVAQEDIMGMVERGMQLGLHAPKFPPKPKAA